MSRGRLVLAGVLVALAAVARRAEALRLAREDHHLEASPAHRVAVADGTWTGTLVLPGGTSGGQMAGTFTAEHAGA